MKVTDKAAHLLTAYQSGRRDFRGWDLSHIVLHDVRLEGVDLSWADLERADLSQLDLGAALLTNANLQGATLDHTYQEHTVLSGHENEDQPEGSAG